MNIDPVAAAIREAGHAEAETRYRLQLAREMYQAGYAAAEADMDRAVERHRPRRRPRPQPRRARGTPLGTRRPRPLRRPAPRRLPRPGRQAASGTPNEKWRPDDMPPHDPGGNRAGRRGLPAVVAVGADSGAHPETRTRAGGTSMNDDTQATRPKRSGNVHAADHRRERHPPGPPDLRLVQAGRRVPGAVRVLAGNQRCSSTCSRHASRPGRPGRNRRPDSDRARRAAAAASRTDRRRPTALSCTNLSGSPRHPTHGRQMPPTLRIRWIHPSRTPSPPRPKPCWGRPATRRPSCQKCTLVLCAPARRKQDPAPPASRAPTSPRSPCRRPTAGSTGCTRAWPNPGQNRRPGCDRRRAARPRRDRQRLLRMAAV